MLTPADEGIQAGRRDAMGSTERWIVEYGDHDCGSPSGTMVRRTEEHAKRSAKLMKECGYRQTSYRKFTN